MSVTTVQLPNSVNRAILFDHEQLPKHIAQIMEWKRYICPFKIFLDYKSNETINAESLLLLDSFFLYDKNVTMETCLEGLFEIIRTQYSNVTHIIWFGDRDFPDGMVNMFFYPRENYTQKFKDNHKIQCIVVKDDECDDEDFCFNLCYKELQTPKLIGCAMQKIRLK